MPRDPPSCIMPHAVMTGPNQYHQKVNNELGLYPPGERSIEITAKYLRFDRPFRTEYGPNLLFTF